MPLLLAERQRHTGMTYGEMDLLPAIPIFCIGFFSFLQVGGSDSSPTRRCAGSLLILGVTTAIRQKLPDEASLIITSITCGAGIANLQAVIPCVIKRQSRLI